MKDRLHNEEECCYYYTFNFVFHFVFNFLIVVIIIVIVTILVFFIKGDGTRLFHLVSINNNALSLAGKGRIFALCKQIKYAHIFFL